LSELRGIFNRVICRLENGDRSTAAEECEETDEARRGVKMRSKHRLICGLEIMAGLCFQWFTLISNCW
jgi:hypothetical protein